MKKIDNNTYHQALAFYILAKRHQIEIHNLSCEVDTLDWDINELLQIGYDGDEFLCDDAHSEISDVIYDFDSIGTKEEFDAALKRQGIEVEENG